MKFRYHIKKFWYLWTALVLILINIAGIFLVVAVFARQANDFELVKKLKVPVDAVKRATDILFLPAGIGAADLEQYNLIIAPKDYESLLSNLPDPDSGEVLTDEYKKEVPAKFIHNGREYNVDIRFRGEGDIHWGYQKKSWRIQFQKDDYFNGYRELHLIVPVDRGYALEEFNLERARALGITVPDSTFVKMTVNGQGPMTYWQIEGWDNDFLERHQKPADANLYNPDIQNIFLNDGIVQYVPLDELTSFSKAIRDGSRVLDNNAELDRWITLLATADNETFYHGFEQLVDMDSFYAWNAVSLLAGSRHTERTNLRLFFDNTVGKFELIPWNIAEGSLDQTLDTTHQRFVSRILTNPKFVHERNKVLFAYMSADNQLQHDLDEYDRIWKEIRGSLYTDRTKLESNLDMRATIQAQREQIKENWQIIESTLSKSRSTAIVRLSQPTLSSVAQFQTGDVLAAVEVSADSFSASLWRKVRVEFAGKRGIDLELWRDVNANGLLDTEDESVATLVYDASTQSSEADGLGIVLYPGRTMLPEPDNRLVPTPLTYYYLLVNPSRAVFEVTDVDLRMSNAVTGEKIDPVVRIVDESIFAYEDRLDDRFEDIKARFGFVRLDGTAIVIPSGNHVLNETFIVPADYTLTISPGAQLDMGPGVSIISFGPITALGTSDQPITVARLDDSKPWGIILSANTKSINSFSYVDISGGSSDYVSGIFSRGMLSVFNGDAVIDHSVFSNAIGDDSVNVKNGNITLTHSTFTKNSFDAFDGDFVTGLISETEFLENGNDGVDVSGSKNLLIRDNRFINNGDKGISVGERSGPTIFNNVLVENNFGIASKDDSDPLIINNVIYRNNTNVAVYMKKQLFGGAHARIFNSILWGAAENISVDGLSSIEVMSSSVEGGFVGEGNREIQPEFTSDYTTAGDAFVGGGNSEILNEVGVQLDSAPIGIIK